MESTSITWVSVSAWAFVFIVALVIYFWKIRPLIRDQVGFSAEKWGLWLKARWDMVTAAVLAVAPVAWNGILDLVVLLSSADLSAVIIPAWLKTTIQIAGIAAPVIRLRMEQKKAADVP